MEITDRLDHGFHVLEKSFLRARNQLPRFSESGTINRGQRYCNLQHRRVVANPSCVGRYVNVFYDGLSSFGHILRQHDLRDYPFYHKIKPRHNKIDTLPVVFREIVGPVPRTLGRIAPSHIYQIFPVHFAQRCFLNEGELLSKNLGAVRKDERDVPRHRWYLHWRFLALDVRLE